MKKKAIKCPTCKMSRSFVDMGPHGMWEIGEIRTVKLYCGNCDSEILRVACLIDVDEDGKLTFQQQTKQGVVGAPDSP